MSVKPYGIVKLRAALVENTLFMTAYKNLLLGRDLTEEQKLYILKIAIIALSMESKDTESAYFGYSLIVRYALLTRDYDALYDVALAKNFMPLVHLIDNIRELQDDSENLQRIFMGSLKTTFKDPRREIYRSEGQLELSAFVQNNDNVAVVAPTSYGKSDLIIDQVKALTTLQKNVCIVVPTKALVSQTKKRLQRRGIGRVITHPDMYIEELYGFTGFVAVLTQERLLSLFTANQNVSLDALFIDEAHNILDDDERSVLLSQAILIAKKRNPDTDTYFFTPFLNDTSNLAVLNSNDPNGFLTSERMKVEKYFYRARDTGTVFLYDHFLDVSIEHASSSVDPIRFVIDEGTDKNIVYLNKPREVSRFATNLAANLPEIEESEELTKAISAIAGYTNPLYNIIACLKKGVLFHHGNMPDVVKSYVEELYSSSSINVRYLVTTSTLLEGVNIPANRLFIANSAIGRDALSDSQLKNLAGRIGRYSELFKEGLNNIALLEPRVYLINHSEYERSNIGNPRNFFNTRVKLGKQTHDKVKNPLLKNTPASDTDRLASELTYLANIEENFNLLDIQTRVAATPIGKASFKHNVRDFNILEVEESLNANLTSYIDQIQGDISSVDDFFTAIDSIFIENIALVEYSHSDLLNKFDSVKNHYRWYIQKSIEHPSLNYLINLILLRWRDVTYPVFVGGMGDVDRNGQRNGWNTNYALISRKNPSDRVSLAISKIKVNQDFIDNCLMKYMEVLNDLDLVAEDFYNLFKYRTVDQFTISLLKQGVSHELAALLAAEYRQLVQIDVNGIITCVGGKDHVLNIMEANQVNEITRTEFKNFV